MFIAHAQLGQIQQADDGGNRAVLAQAALRQVAVQPGAQPGQGAAEVRAAGIFRRLLRGAEIGMIAILLASLVVISRRLDMAKGGRAEPAVAIGGGQGDGVQPVDFVPVGDSLPITIIIGPSAFERASRDAGACIIRVDECGLGHIFLLMPQNPPFIASFRNPAGARPLKDLTPNEGEIYASH